MPQRYTRVAVVLHWLIAVMIVTNVVLAWTWGYLPDADVRPTIDVHKSIGVTVLGLALLRLLWRLSHPAPPFPKLYRPWEVTMSHVVHGLLYLVMLGLPLSGWIMDSAWDKAAANPMHYFGLFEWPRIAPIVRMDPATKKHLHSLFGTGHTLSAYALYALLFLHVAGALKHQFIDRERELQRMWPGS
jgi:cytochrome b561